MFMNKLRLARALIIAMVIILAGVGCFFWGWRMALSRLTLKTVSATQTANAMKNDNFYSNYNENTLVIHGVVSAITNQNNDLVIGLNTSSTYKTFCDLGQTSSYLQKGDVVTVLAEGAAAERQANAILLKNCIELPI
jgi:hypothetical protein